MVDKTSIRKFIRSHFGFLSNRIFAYRYGINKRVVEKRIKRIKVSGVIPHIAGKEIIISLTSYPERMKNIHYTLFSLLSQAKKPNKVILWLAKDLFPNGESDVPEKVIALTKWGLTIGWVQTDIKSYTKLLPTLNKFKHSIIVTADDDIYYPAGWLESLVAAYRKSPGEIHCHRAIRIGFDKITGDIKPYSQWSKAVPGQSSYLNLLTGVGGVLYPENSLHNDVIREEYFSVLSPSADDIWFWSMAVLMEKKINVIPENVHRLIYVNPYKELGISNEKTLHSINVAKNQNDIQLKRVLEAYPLLAKRLRESWGS